MSDDNDSAICPFCNAATCPLCDSPIYTYPCGACNGLGDKECDSCCGGGFYHFCKCIEGDYERFIEHDA